MKSRGYVLDGIDQLNFKEFELRPLEPGEALVEVKAAGICGSDIPRIFINGTYHFPTIPGHEFAGRVAAVYEGDCTAENVEPIDASQWIGKRVGVFPLIPCRDCAPCREMHYEMCEHYSYLGSRTDGGFAEYCIVPIWNLIELPENIDYEQAAMMEPAAVALHAVRRLGLEPKSCESTNSDLKVLVMGLGTIGGIIAQWLSLCNVQDVVATGHHVEQGDLMWLTASENYHFIKTAGYASAIDAAKAAGETLEENSFDMILDCVDTAESLQDALRLVKPAGQIVEVGNPKGDMHLQKDLYWKILRKQVHLTGTWNSSYRHDKQDDWNLVADYLANGKLHLTPLITHRLQFEELEKGLEIMRHRADFCNKVLIQR